MQRYAKLHELMTDIDNTVKEILMNKTDFFYRRQLGYMRFVTVRSDIWCADLLKHFNNPSPPSPPSRTAAASSKQYDVSDDDDDDDDDVSFFIDIDEIHPKPR